MRAHAQYIHQPLGNRTKVNELIICIRIPIRFCGSNEWIFCHHGNNLCLLEMASTWNELISQRFYLFSIYLTVISVNLRLIQDESENSLVMPLPSNNHKLVYMHILWASEIARLFFFRLQRIFKSKEIKYD